MTGLNPQLELRWDRRSGDVRVNAADIRPGLDIRWHDLDTYIDVRDVGDSLVLTVGHPIIGDKIDIDSAVTLLMDGHSPAGINGQFLFVFYDRRTKALRIINDRFTSYPVYFADLDDAFMLNTSYQRLARKLKQQNRLRINPAHCYEYILLQRLIGLKTLDLVSEYMAPAMELQVTIDKVTKRQYWTPDFTKRRRTSREAGAELASLFKTSLRRVTSDGKKYGVMLSAGHDSRTIAMAADRAMQCFTVAYSENLEVRLARDIATKLGHDHHFVCLDADHLVKTANEAAKLCSGMYTIDNALFFGIEDEVAPRVDVLLHGHGIDYMFQGMYIPSNTLNILGRPTFLKSKKSLGSDLPDYFLENIGYRLKFIDRRDYLLPEHVDSAYDEVRQSVANALDNAPANCVAPEDRWEFMIINGLSRHYSWPNIGSKMTLAQVRTPAFDNDIFDFYLSLPAEMRVTAKALRTAQLLMNRKAALISTANFGFPAAETPLMKTVRLILRKVIRDVTGDKSRAGPALVDRTWPDRDLHLCAQPGYQALVREAVISSELEQSLPQFDWPKIRTLCEGWMQQPQGAAGFLVSLVSLHLFLRSLD